MSVGEINAKHCSKQENLENIPMPKVRAKVCKKTKLAVKKCTLSTESVSWEIGQLFYDGSR